MSDAAHEAYLKSIENENDELRERVRVLEELLGFRIEVPTILGLTPSESKVMGFLIKRDLATKDQIMQAIYFDRPLAECDQKIVDVFICKIRKKVKDFPIEIATVWGQGYRLTPESKAVLKQMLTTETTSEPEQRIDEPA